jgi:hypothetical protein
MTAILKAYFLMNMIKKNKFGFIKLHLPIARIQNAGTCKNEMKGEIAS